MIKKTLEEYKIEFEEIKNKIYENALIAENEYEQLIRNCISDYPDNVLAFVECSKLIDKLNILLNDNHFKYLNPHLNKISINDIFCLKNIEINDIEKCNEIYILGENGVGKTVLLQTIIKGILRQTDNIEISYTNGEGFYEADENLNLFAYGVSRFRTGLIKDEDFDNSGFETLFSRNKLLIDVEWWLKDIQRKESLSKTNTSILTIGNSDSSKIGLKIITDLIKDVVNFDNSNDLNIAFDFQKDKFVFIEKGTITDFENIADGFRSVLIWLCDLLRRLIENQPRVEKLEDFYGVVLVDEIDMFLHPKWEYSIVKKLREKLPNIQWFFTTHSPMLILGASEDAVFYKLYKENGITQISEQWKCSDIDNMLANAILTSPLFDMETARMRVFEESNKEIDTSSNFWYSKIEKIIKQEKNKQKNEGKSYFSEEEIQDIVSKAISKIKTELKND